ADAFEQKTKDVDARQAALKSQIKQIEAPYEKQLRQQAYTKFPEATQRAIAKPEQERTPGEQLLAQQIIQAVNISGAAIDKVMSPEDAAKKKALAARMAATEKERPKPIPL